MGDGTSTSTVLAHAIFADGSPGGIKAILEMKKICSNYFRLPVVGVSKTHYHYLNALVDAF